jgi:serine/threonine protein kinase/Tfp pilus assembly protein PilF
MNPERLQQIEDLYHSARKRELSERGEFLAESCRGDEELRREVESLLAQNAAGDVMERPALEVAASLLAQETVPQLAMGARLGPYQIESPLGAGGMGQVYKARDTRLGRAVAIKVSAGQFSNRFEREARAIAALNHPHICTLYDVGPNYLVTELVEGETLLDWLKRAPAVARGIEIAEQILEALRAAHDAGIVHRDLKPANVMVRSDGYVKVLDFGLAKQIPGSGALVTERTATLGPTLPGQLLGTAAYMSPEQILGQEIDQRSDLFAFGIILYEMLAGQHPWPRKSRVDTLHAILHDELPPLSAGSATGTGLIAIVQKLLRKNPAERYPSAGAVLEALAGRTARDRARSDKPRRASRKRVRSLAVLPLADLSGGREQDYFADGMTDALITTLAQIHALRVISRTSVMQYKGVIRPLPEIARELNVEAVLAGTVLRSGDRIRIAAQLIDASTDTHLWAKNYESDLRDILSVQSEVAQAIAEEIKLKLTPQERARMAAAQPVNPEAYEAFLKGRYHWFKRSPDALRRGLEYFRQAIALDHTYALSHAGLADSYGSLGWDLFAAMPPAEAFPKAKLAAQAALALDPNCAEAHAQLGHVAGFYEWDWPTAETELRRALELKPQYSVAHIWYSHVLHAVGRTAESFAESQRAVECDPLGLILNLHLGWNYLYDRKCERAIEQLQKTMELQPDFLLAYLFLGEAYEQSGNFGGAITQFERAVILSERRPIYLAGLGHAYAASGQRDRATEIIDELQQAAGSTYVPARGIAEIYVGLGEGEQAFAWLDKAVEQRNGWLFHIKTNPRYDSLRSDPRYADLVRRIGLP